MPESVEICELSDDDGPAPTTAPVAAKAPPTAAAVPKEPPTELPKAAKSKAVPKKKEPKAKPKVNTKSKAMKKPAAAAATGPDEPNEPDVKSGQPLEPEGEGEGDEPVAAKRPAAKASRKRPATAAASAPDKRTARKYCYHKDQKWGIALNGPGGGEFCTVGRSLFCGVSPFCSFCST